MTPYVLTFDFHSAAHLWDSSKRHAWISVSNCYITTPPRTQAWPILRQGSDVWHTYSVDIRCFCFADLLCFPLPAPANIAVLALIFALLYLIPFHAIVLYSYIILAFLSFRVLPAWALQVRSLSALYSMELVDHSHKHHVHRSMLPIPDSAEPDSPQPSDEADSDEDDPRAEMLRTHSDHGSRNSSKHAQMLDPTYSFSWRAFLIRALALLCACSLSIGSH